MPSTDPGRPSALGTLIAWLLGVGLAALFVVVPLDLQAQALLGGFVFLVALVLNRRRGRLTTLALVGMSIAVSARYMYWRLTATMDLHGGFTFSNAMAVVLFSAEFYTFVVLLLGFLQSSWPLDRRPVPLPDDPRTWPTVDIYIPSYNEPLDVVRTTVFAAKRLDWPADKLNIYILDDGRRKSFRAFAKRADVGYIVRADNSHAKAGNINNALKRTKGEFIAIFDCDHVPTRSYLQYTMGWMVRDPKLSMVQTPHHFYSPDPFERNLGTFKRVPNEGELFYGLLQPGNDLWNAVFFCGSCATIRRTALLEVGGIAVETVTEDAHTALKMQRRGWNTAFLDVPQASGLATETLSSHVGQRIRWARGMIQIFRTDNPLFGPGLTLWQRLCYTSAMVHFLFGAPRLIFLVAPLSYLFFGAHIFNAAPLLVLAYAVPHLVHSQLTNSRLQGRFRHSFWAEVYESALAWYILIPTTVALIRPGWGKFNVTAKGGIQQTDVFDGTIARPYLVVLVLNLIGIVLGVHAYVQGWAQADAVFINVFWAFYNIMVLGATLAVAWERRQVRRFPRVDVELPAILHHEASGRAYRCRTDNISFGGAMIRGVAVDDLEPGEPVTLGIEVNYEEYPLSCRVVGHKGDGVRLEFDNLTLREQEWLTAAVFGRSDAWAHWSGQHEPDRPLGAIASIWSHAFGALGRTAGWAMRFGRAKASA